MWASGGCRPRAGQGAQGTHWERVPCVEGPGVEFAQRLRHLMVCVESVEIEKSLARLLNFQCADNDVVGPFSTRQAATMLPAAEGDVDKSAGFAEKKPKSYFF